MEPLADADRVARRLGPAALADPDVRAAPVAPATADDVVRTAVVEATRRLLLADPHARLGLDVEGVHQARVATRRLRSDLRTVRALVDPAWAVPLREELAWLADALGAVRDADVLTGRLRDALERLDPQDRDGGRLFADRLADQRAAARAELDAVLSSDRYVALLDSLVAACCAPHLVAPDQDGPAEQVLPDLVRGPWRHLRTDVRALGDDPADADLHRVRIRAKRLRYAAELAAGALGRRAERMATAAARLQTVLGDHHDAVVMERWIRATVDAATTPPQAFVAGLLAGQERAAADEAAGRWWDEWARLDREKVRGWL